MRPLVGVHAAHHLANSRERRDAYSDRATIGVGICLRLNLEPRRLLHHRQRCLRFLSGTLVNRLHRLRDYRHAQWSKCSSLSPSARRSARRSVTRYLAYGTADRLLIADAGADCPRYGPYQIQPGSMGPVHGSCWLCILVGCVFFLFSILDFPLILHYLYNLITPRRSFRPRNIDHARTDGPALATFTVAQRAPRAVRP